MKTTHTSEPTDVVNKLIVLFIMDKLEMPVSNLQLTKLVLEHKYMNYFLFQQVLSDLSDSFLIEAHSNGSSTFFMITDQGRKTLEYFTDRIPPGIVAFIDNNIQSIRAKIKHETSVHAEIIEESENQFVCVCRIQEEMFTLLDVKITVGTKADAQFIINNWKHTPQVIYEEILESMRKKRL